VCRFIDAEKATEDNPGGYGIALMCRVMGINRSTCYAWPASRPAVAERCRAEDELAGRIREGGDVVPLSYKGHRFPAEVIAHCVWLYHLQVPKTPSMACDVPGSRERPVIAG
jgi:hypothetical protein